MDIQTFLKFPGILILIGIALLIISIIIGIFAYKKPKYKEEFGDNQPQQPGQTEEPIYEASNNTSSEPPVNFFQNTNLYDNNTENAQPTYSINEVTMEQSADIANENPTIANDTYEEVNGTQTAYIEATQDSIEISTPVIETTPNEQPIPVVEENNNPVAVENNIPTESNNPQVIENNTPTEDNNPQVTISDTTDNNQQFNTGAFDINEFTQAEIEKIDIPSDNDITIDSFLKEEIKNEPIVTPQVSEEIVSEVKEESVNEKIVTPQVEEAIPQVEETVPQVDEEPQPEEPRAIYGGTTPLENVTLDFKEERHDAYSNTSFQPTGNIVTPQVEEKKVETKEPEKTEDEDIELL